jgi:hypothetical protein
MFFDKKTPLCGRCDPYRPTASPVRPIHKAALLLFVFAKGLMVLLKQVAAPHHRGTPKDCPFKPVCQSVFAASCSQSGRRGRWRSLVEMSRWRDICAWRGELVRRVSWWSWSGGPRRAVAACKGRAFAVYDLYMSMKTYPLSMPPDLLHEVKRTAKETGLSMADAMRQALKRGLPQVRMAMSREEDFSESIMDTWEKLGPAPTILYDKL